MMLPALLLHDGDLFAPEPRGRGSVLVIDGRVASIGPIALGEATRAADVFGLDLDVLDARGLLLAPGFIDPHEHLLGPSGARRGCPVDIDTSDQDLPRWLDAYEQISSRART